MLLCTIGSYLIKRQSERHIMIDNIDHLFMLKTPNGDVRLEGA